LRYLLDTHLLLLATVERSAVTQKAAELLEGSVNELFFSAASLWEIAIKFGRGKADFTVDPEPLRRSLVRTGYTELSITGEQAMYVSRLPPIHKDPFDRLLVAQATVEGIILLTSDRLLAQYPGPIQRV
jgi:PIN domain nuclease of toxin-antitoxin system